MKKLKSQFAIKTTSLVLLIALLVLCRPTPDSGTFST
jgi:hypothetical protein